MHSNSGNLGHFLLIWVCFLFIPGQPRISEFNILKKAMTIYLHMFGFSIDLLLHLEAKELANKCHQILKDNHIWCNRVTGVTSPLPHLFPNLLDMVPQSALSGSSFDDVVSNVAKAPLTKRCTCLSMCTVTGTCGIPSVDFDTGGLPCVDYASCGKHRGTSGISGPLFVAWAKRHKEQKTKLLLLENAPATWKT